MSNDSEGRATDAPSKDGFAELARTVVYALLIALVFRTFLFQAFTIPSGSMKPTLLVGDYLLVAKYSYGYSRFSLPFGSRLPGVDGRFFGATPERGDVIVFRNPANEREDYIKRVVGLPGDTVELRRGVLYVNGRAAPQAGAPVFKDDSSQDGMCPANAERSYDCETAVETLSGGIEHAILPGRRPISTRDYQRNTCVYTVPDGQFFFLGDNRTNSADSRFGHRAPFGQDPEGVDCENLQPGAPLGYRSSGTGYVPAENLIGRADIVLFSSAGAFWELWNWRSDRFFKLID